MNVYYSPQGRHTEEDSVVYVGLAIRVELSVSPNVIRDGKPKRAHAPSNSQK